MSAISTCRFFRAEPRALDQLEERHRARFRAHHIPPSTVLVTVEGEVDATNSRALARYVESQVVGSAHLLLDLRHVDFFGTAGFAALHNVNVVCSHYGLTWALQAGGQVRRLLEICDPDGGLPLEERGSVAENLNAGPGDRQLFIGRDH